MAQHQSSRSAFPLRIPPEVIEAESECLQNIRVLLVTTRTRFLQRPITDFPCFAGSTDSIMEQALENRYGPPRQASASRRGSVKRFWDEHRKYRLKGVSTKFYRRKKFSLAPLGLLLYLSLGASAQLQQTYCSSQNTGTDHYVGSMYIFRELTTANPECCFANFHLCSRPMANSRSL